MQKAKYLNDLMTQYESEEIISKKISEISYEQIYGKIIYKSRILSAFGKLMNNRISYYILFMSIGVVVSIEIISSMFKKDEDDARE